MLAPRIEPPLTLTDIVMYQGAADDRNPIHHDPEFAQAAGYSGPFAVGMLAGGILADYAVNFFGVENIRKFKVQFLEQAWPKDVITYSGCIVAIRDVGPECFVDIELFATRQTGGVHVKGWATFLCNQIDSTRASEEPFA